MSKQIQFFRVLAIQACILVLLIFSVTDLMAEASSHLKTNSLHFPDLPPAKLYVHSNIEGFSVSLLGYDEAFHQGIELSPGKYKVKVTFADGKSTTTNLLLSSKEERDHIVVKNRYRSRWEARESEKMVGLRHQTYMDSISGSLTWLETPSGKRLEDFPISNKVIERYPSLVGLILVAENLSDFQRVLDFRKLERMSERKARNYRGRLVRNRVKRWMHYWGGGHIKPGLSKVGFALDVVPSSAYYTYLRGKYYKIAGNLKGALVEYEAAIKLDPNLAHAYNSMAWLLAVTDNDMIRDEKKAIKLAKQAVELLPHPKYLDTLAVTHASNGEWEEAISTVEKAITLLENETDEQKLKQELQQHLRAFRDQVTWREREVISFPDDIELEIELLKQAQADPISAYAMPVDEGKNDKKSLKGARLNLYELLMKAARKNASGAKRK